MEISFNYLVTIFFDIEQFIRIQQNRISNNIMTSRFFFLFLSYLFQKNKLIIKSCKKY